MTEKWQKKIFNNIVTFHIFLTFPKSGSFLMRLAGNLFLDLATVLTGWWVVLTSDRAGPPLNLMYWHDQTGLTAHSK
jgi:hypothetical protein